MDYAKIDDYLHGVIPKRPAVLMQMERYAREHHFPIIGPLAGRLLFQLASTIKAKRVLELGSGFGYSAVWFSLAMGKSGRLHLTDMDVSNRERAMTYFAKGKVAGKITFEVGDALAIAAKLKGKYDLILNDIDKAQYPRTIELAARLLRPGGLFVTDNLLWSGRVYQQKQDATTREIVRFTRLLMADKRFFTTILPLRDGLAVALRK
jgi:predicted O-methyltransferase YrrM